MRRLHVKQHFRVFEKRWNHATYDTLLTAAMGACWPKARVAGQPHVDLDDSCVRHGAVRDDSFHQVWSCPVINAIPHDNTRNSQHLFQGAKREKNTSLCFWTSGMVPVEWMEVLPAWDVVEPRVKHNSCDTLKEWAKSNCLIMFLDGTGGPFSSDFVLRRCGWEVAVLDFTDVFAPSLVFGRGGGLLGAKQTVPRSEVHAGLYALRFARETPLFLVSENEYFVSTAEKGRANPVGPCSDLWHQYWVAVEYHAAAIFVMKVKSRASVHAGNEFADRLAAKGAEAQKIAAVRNLSRTGQRRALPL